MKIASLLLFFLSINCFAEEKDFKGNPSLVKNIYFEVKKTNNIWKEGKIMSIFESYYDKEGKLIKEIEKRNGKDIVLQKRYDYLKGEIAKKFCDDLFNKNKDFKNQYIEEACKSSRLSIKIQYNIDLELNEEKPFRYYFNTETEKEKEEYCFDYDFFLEYKKKYIYEKGELIKEIKYNSDLRQIERKEYKHDQEKKNLNIKTFDENEILKKEIVRQFRLDDTIRKITEINYDDSEQVFSKTETLFDSNGVEYNQKEYSQNGELNMEANFKYEYDLKGNWIKLIKNKKKIVYGKDIGDKIPPEIIRREIIY